MRTNRTAPYVSEFALLIFFVLLTAVFTNFCLLGKLENVTPFRLPPSFARALVNTHTDIVSEPQRVRW